MKRVFKIKKPFCVPDGTLVSPFLNAKGALSGLPFDLLDGFSVAAGTIEPRTESKIHVMPFVTQVTFVRNGKLLVRMKAKDERKPYLLRLENDQAVLTKPGTLFQLINAESEPCTVLYIVSPPYLFEISNGNVVYDDSVVLDESWQDLEAAGWQPSIKFPIWEQRQDAERRLASRSR